MKPTVFIQSNKKQLIGALLAKYSIIKNSHKSNQFDVKIMLVEDMPNMLTYENKQYFKGTHPHLWTVADLQSFTMTRFLPPQLMGYEGRALVIDPDVFATAGTDVMELLEKDMQGKAILACSAGPQKFKSSVMLLDCKKLTHWRWEESLREIFTAKRDYRAWMNLELEPADTIGTLGDEWNHCDTLNDKTKLIHYTRRVTQPWKTGLNVDFKYDIPSRFSFLPRLLLIALKKMRGGNNIYHTKYQRNPDQSQENFFFTLLKTALQERAVTEEFLNDCISNAHVRKDIGQIIKST